MPGRVGTEHHGPVVKAAIGHIIDHVVVVVPANDEVDLICETIRSIQRASHELPATMTVALTIVADTCSDATVTAANALLDPKWDRVVFGDFGTAGAARRVGARAALRSSDHPASAIWMASTDADTVVPIDWLTSQLAHASSGVVAVAGVVRLNADRQPGRSLSARFSRSYEIAADWTHPHVHGANLGIRGDTYQAAGGWRCLATGEDHELWAQASRLGPTVSDARIWVETDPRLRGRAPDGFARDLAELCGAA